MKSEELGNRIRSRRLTLGLKQQSLAEIAGLSVHGLSNIESGKGNPTLAVLNQLADALGLDLRLDVPRPGDLGTKQADGSEA
jgi:transcriptional regulator with XRE-family HTH domain